MASPEQNVFLWMRDRLFEQSHEARPDVGNAAPLDLFRGSWKYDLLEWCLWVLAFPLWVAWWIWEDSRSRAETRPFVRGRVEQAWERCAEYWKECGIVLGPRERGVPFPHELAVALARQFPGRRQFFLAKLADHDPLLAAYAFKCLIRMGDLRRHHPPESVQGRCERVKVLSGLSCCIDEEPLGLFFEGYFLQREQQITRLPLSHA
jgi:hypothetical protein